MVWEHLQFQWQAFWDLHTDRPMGMSVGPIPFGAIHVYADRYGIEGVDEFDAFRDLIRAMDDAYLTWSAKRRDKPKP
jgi:hypothetical protein